MNARQVAGDGTLCEHSIYGDFTHSDESEPVEETSRYSLEKIKQSIRNFATVSEILRTLGAMIILASMSIFLLQSWQQGNDINRYLMLLTQTGLLAMGGFSLSYLLKENKGARIFFGLALVSVTANFTILGAMLYSVVQWDSGLLTYPAFATWSVAGISKFGFTMAGAILALIPITLLGFAIMARRSMRPLTINFLAINSLLLLPMRGSTQAGVIALAGIFYALYLVRTLIAKDRTLKTPEGKFAIATLFLPLGIILFRSMYFYQVEPLLITLLSVAVFMVLRQAALAQNQRATSRCVIDILSLPVAMSIAFSLTNALKPLLNEPHLLPLFAITFSLFAVDVIRRTGNRILAVYTGGFVSVICALCFTVNAMFFDSVLTAMSCLFIGAIMALTAHGFAQKFAQFVAYITIATGAWFCFWRLADLIMQSSWIDLAIIGAVAIALASLLDRHGAAFKLRISRSLDKVGHAKTVAVED